MAKLMFAVMAERISVDRFSNAIDVLNILEQVHTPELPAELIAKAKEQKRRLAVGGKFALLVHWRRSDISKPERRCRQRVELRGPNNAVLGAPAEMDFSLQDSNYVRNIVAFAALPFAGEGTYTASISLLVGSRWRKVGETSFQLSYQQAGGGGTRRRLQ